MIVDRSGRLILTDEICRFCHAPSRGAHPSGVIRDLWKCARCGRWQHEDIEPAINHQVEDL
jgi:hypothetical protein